MFGNKSRTPCPPRGIHLSTSLRDLVRDPSSHLSRATDPLFESAEAATSIVDCLFESIPRVHEPEIEREREGGEECSVVFLICTSFLFVCLPA